MTRLSKNWTLDELIYSYTAASRDIDNTPSEAVKENLQILASETLQPISDYLGRPMTCLSGYRCHALNRIVGGAENSDHLIGLAADISAHQLTNIELFDAILSIPNYFFGQLILENLDGKKWVHISHGTKREVMRTDYRDKQGKAVYVYLSKGGVQC